jgi:hypothetical protein
MESTVWDGSRRHRFATVGVRLVDTQSLALRYTCPLQSDRFCYFQVALATPCLWRFIDFTRMSRKWCTEMLRRSGHCSLEITFRFSASCSGPYSAPSPLDIVVRPEYSTRLAGLKLDLSWLSRNDVESTLHSLQRSAPLLESLMLQQTSWEPIKIHTLTGYLPNIRRFTLRNICLSPWVSSVFTNLHELHLCFDRHHYLYSQDTLPSYDDIATILGRVLELRCLMLRNVFTEGSNASSEKMPSKPISLLKLQSLSLIDQQECDLLSFASLLRLPSMTCAEIRTNGRVWKYVSSPASLFSQYERTFGPVRRLKLWTNGHPQITLEFRVSDALTVDSSAPSQLRLDYALPIPFLLPRATGARVTTTTTDSESPPHRRMALHFGDISLRLDDLLYLEVVSHATWPADSWHDLFLRATRLQQIRATYHGAVDGFIQVLLLAHPAHERESEQTPPLLLFPNLRSVKISLVDLDEAVTPPRSRGDMLVEGLARRRELGFGIKELEVSDHDGQWMSKLREIVSVVTHADI